MAGLGFLILILSAGLLPSAVEDSAEIVARWQATSAGQERAVVLERDLLDCPASELGVLQKSAYGFFLEEMKGFRGQSAERMAGAMHSRAGATWSMICLSGSQLRTGRATLAVQSVQEHLARIEASAPMEEVRAVWDRLALVARGAGMEELMLDALGQSLVMGSEDALQLLGWEGLLALDHARAASLFGALLDRAGTAAKEPAPWALPGWGLSLLERGSQ